MTDTGRLAATRLRVERMAGPVSSCRSKPDRRTTVFGRVLPKQKAALWDEAVVPREHAERQVLSAADIRRPLERRVSAVATGLKENGGSLVSMVGGSQSTIAMLHALVAGFHR